MHLIAPLVAGVRGAEEGTCRLYRRGTSLPATWYPDFEASAQDSSGAAILLDSYGGKSVYVDELVDVVVFSATGVELRRFVAGDSAPAVEVRSTSFTGTDYEDASEALGYPTTLQEVLDQVAGSIGPNWLVPLGDGGALIGVTDAITRLDLGYHNVKSSTYGATGDDVADDTPAIQAACTAAGAAGGVVYFPPGTYRHTGFEVPQNVSLLGAGPSVSILNLDHATNDAVSFTPATVKWSTVSQLGFTNAQDGAGALITVGEPDGWHSISNCRFAPAFAMASLINSGAVAAVMRVLDCYFAPTEYLSEAVGLSGSALVMGCEFVAAAGAAGLAAMLQVSGVAGNGLSAFNNVFNMEDAVSWAAQIIRADLASYLIVGGNRITNLSGSPAVQAWSASGATSNDLGNTLGSALTMPLTGFSQISTWQNRGLSQAVGLTVTLSAYFGKQVVVSNDIGLTITLPPTAGGGRTLYLTWHNNQGVGVTPVWIGSTRGDVAVLTNGNCFALYELRNELGYWVVVLVENNIPE